AVLTGGKAAEPANPVRVGYTFIGWYKDEEFDEAWDFEEDTVTEDITLYAKWEIITYTVTWNTDGGTPDPAQTTVEHDGSITDPGAALRSGYAFAGWYSDEDFLSEAVFPVPYVTEDMEFYAKWLRIYTVDWNADGGTPAPSQMFLKHGDKIYEPDAMEKTGHVFLGWYKDSDFAEAWDFNSGAVEGPVNLYALWIDGVSVLSPDRVIPNKPDVQNPGVPSANVMSGEFTAGPNPVVKSAGKVDLFWQGSGIKSSTLYIYDASGNLVKKVNVTDKSIGKSDRRVVGTWDLKNSKGYAVSAGTYVVKGKIATRDGKSERVSLILSIR
ncbi:MAG: InlB B-repeat-containing protein, partial [Chitinispirillales bacterium]|nr:InlB B-repeat-containing protein [Chitinispirillales bacterium]